MVSRAQNQSYKDWTLNDRSMTLFFKQYNYDDAAIFR